MTGCARIDKDRRQTVSAAVTPRSSARRRAIVLILVLVVVVVLSLAAYTFSDLMLTYQETVQLSGKQLQARMLVESGAEYMRLFLNQEPAALLDSGGLYDNPLSFQAVPVAMGEDATLRGNFTVLAPALDDQGYLGGVRYGLEDESNRLNLNALMALEKQQEGTGRTLLLALPGMTEDVADSILDWLDEDEEEREYGAESGYYGSLDPPYGCKNGPLDTVEELLLIRGVMPEMLFGLDVNRNGMVDSFEMSVSGTTGATTSTATATDMGGGSNRGWSGYISLHSAEANVNSEGFQRIYLNTDNMEELHKALDEVFDREWADFIVAYRQYGPAGAEPQQGDAESESESPSNSSSGSQNNSQNNNSQNNSQNGSQSGSQGGSRSQSTTGTQGGSQSGSQSGGPSSSQSGSQSGSQSSSQSSRSRSSSRSRGSVDLDLTVPGSVQLVQVLDLIGATVEVPSAEEGEDPVELESPFADDPAAMATYLPLLMDHVTIQSAATIPGRININQAPREILIGIPGITEEIVDELLNARSAEPDPADKNRQFETWILAEGIVTLDEMRGLAPFINAGGDVYRAQVVGYYEDGSASSRAEIVFDGTASPPRVLFWRDISHLGRGYALETLGLQMLDTVP
jgi:hypothetical protein